MTEDFIPEKLQKLGITTLEQLEEYLIKLEAQGGEDWKVFSRGVSEGLSSPSATIKTANNQIKINRAWDKAKK